MSKNESSYDPSDEMAPDDYSDSFDGWCATCGRALNNQLRCGSCDYEKMLEAADMLRKIEMENR